MTGATKRTFLEPASTLIIAAEEFGQQQVLIVKCSEIANKRRLSSPFKTSAAPERDSPGEALQSYGDRK